MSPSTLDRHLKSLLKRRLDQLAEALAGARHGGDVEAVHDLRVASRRLRAFGVAFRGLLGEATVRRLEKKLKRVTRSVGALRDLDVQIALVEGRLACESTVKTSSSAALLPDGSSSPEAAAPNEAAPPAGVPLTPLARAALEQLAERLIEQRASVARRAERRLDELDVQGTARATDRALRTVTGELAARGQEAFARSVLEERVDDAAAQMPAPGLSDDPERYHRLRIDFKQLRYALELFEPMLGTELEEMYSQVVALQELLGEWHDRITLGEVLEQRSRELSGRERWALAKGLASVSETLAAEREALLAQFRARGFDARSWRASLARALGSS